MNAEDLARLLDAYRDGTISEPDARRLAEAIREGGETSRAILRELRFEGVLARALEGEDDAAFARSFRERVAAEESEGDFVRDFERRRLRTASPPRTGGGWIPWVVAAAALVAILLSLPSAPAPTPSPKVAERASRPPSETPETSREETPAPESPKPQPPRREESPVESPKPPEPAPPEKKPEVPSAPALVPDRPVEEKVAPAQPQPALLTLAAVRGRVFAVDGAARVAVSEGQGIVAGQGLECVGPGSAAVVHFSDGTRLELGPDTLLREVVEKKGKRMVLVKGTLSAHVARQPVDSPMIFATPQAEARVLGTSLRLEVDSHTRLEVTEGKVRLTRNGGKGADVAAGSFASAGPGLDPLPRALHPDEVILPASQARLVGDEWALVPDRNASGGWVLQVAKSPFKPIDHVENRPSYAVFTFHASADRDYRLWVRSTSVPTSDKWLRDLVTVEPLGCTMSQKSPFFGAAPTTAFVFTGLSTWSGYAWSSGAFEEAKPDKEPIVVRFQKTGTQTLRLFTVHPSIRVDAVWLSAHQASRPAAKSYPPAEGR